MAGLFDRFVRAVKIKTDTLITRLEDADRPLPEIAKVQPPTAEAPTLAESLAKLDKVVAEIGENMDKEIADIATNLDQRPKSSPAAPTTVKPTAAGPVYRFDLTPTPDETGTVPVHKGNRELF